MKIRHFVVALSFVLGVLTLLVLLRLMDSATASASPANPVERPLANAAVTRYVAINGTDSGDCSTPAGPCRTIQYAVDRAGAGDGIRVAAGVYTDVNTYAGLRQVVYISKTLTVRGGYTTTDWGTSNPISYPVTLDAKGQGRVLYITGHISPTFEGLQITGGKAAGLGGSSGVIGAGADAGGGLYAITATVTLINNQVFSNAAYHGGGVFFYYSPGATLRDNIVASNTTTNLAGGLYFRNSPGATLTANTISNNFAGASGGMQHNGGARFENSDDVTLIGNTISGNHADNQCGGICFVGDNHNATLIENDIFGNSAGIPDSGFVNSAGGGLSFITSKGASLIDNVISDNSSTTYGGGVYLERSDVTMINNVIIDNQIMPNTIVTGSGSALYTAGSSPRLLHTTLARNSGGDGSGVYATDVFSSFSTVAMTNTILVSHSVGLTVTANNTATLNGVLWYNNSTNYGGGGTITVTNAYTGDPAFADDGYHLTATSAAIDRGVNSGVDKDIDGDPRPLDGNLDGTSIADMGADEFFPNPSLAVTKLANRSSIDDGEPLTYTLRVINTGNVTLNVTVTDTLPYWVTPTGVLTWKAVIPAPGGIWGQQVVVALGTGHIGSFTNKVQVTTEEGPMGKASVTVCANQCFIYLPLAMKHWPPNIHLPHLRDVAR